jgi:hypothetical protein
MHRLVLAAIFAVALSACATASSAGPTPPAEPAPTGSSDADSTTAPSEGADRRADTAMRARLASLPRCAEGAVVGQLALAPGTCTRKFCRSACCNACTWDADYQTKGGPERVSKDLVRAVLALPDGALDCEVAAWNAALAGVSLGLENGGCVVR